MAVSPFAFLRGSPAVMAADLAAVPDTGLIVQLCGDAHVSNFGVFASPERDLLFDLNDFDETAPGPFEWDVKRLAASAAVAARQNGLDDKAARAMAREAAGAYRRTMRELAALGELAVWYRHIDVADILARIGERHRPRKRAETVFASARRRTSLRALGKLTRPGPGGEPRIRHDPPVLEPIPPGDFAAVEQVFADYRASLPDDVRTLLDRFRLVDAARKVVGVGSVGTRCFVALLLGRDRGDPLFLQVKEAEAAVLARHHRAEGPAHQGRRVVAGQRLLQAASDIFLGWATGPEGRHFYWRQLWDMKGSIVLEDLRPEGLRLYAGLCGTVLAHAHARAGERGAIAAYLGASDRFDRAIADFALRYADQTAADYKAFLQAIDDERLPASETG
ncbi:MAG: DUF2252 domain-containing protein [Streptomycetaceae bacterium]|nr:DUF2252 domain-containing protein [Streptomycetaceae bacterium]